MSIVKSLNAASGVLKRFGEFIGKHKPDTKVAVGIIGNAYAMYLVYKKAPEIKEGLEKKDYISVAKAAAAPVLTKVCADGLTISAVKDFHNDINAARTVASAAEAMNSLRVAAENEVLTKSKVQEVDHQIAKDISDHFDEGKYPIIDTGRGKSLIYDPLSQRLIRDDISKLYDNFYEIEKAVCCGERIFMNEFWDMVPKVPIQGLEYFSGFDLELGIPSMSIQVVDRGPNSEKFHVMVWKNVGYFLEDRTARIDRGYLGYDANNTYWS